MRRIYYLMGKSASGKDTLYRLLLQDKELELSPLVIYTTRPVRSGEKEGVDYHFTDEAHLEELQEAGRVIELRRYNTVHGIWTYFTVDDFAAQEEDRKDYLGIGTLESFLQLRRYYGADRVIPLYVEVEDGLRLYRALERERAQAVPRYEEMCRRFLSDQKDFAPEKLQEAGLEVRFSNDARPEECLAKIRDHIRRRHGESL